MNLGLADRACVVTGASRGIGRAISHRLASEGAAVLLVGRHGNRLEEVAQSCRDAGARAETAAIDLCSHGAVDLLVAECMKRLGRIDVLVNNAGGMAIKGFDQLTDEDWQAQWELNVIVPMRLMRAVAPVMADRGWGRIVNVCSSTGKRPSMANMAYSVTKAAELSLSRVFADQFAPRGVLVNAVTPGPVGTPLWLGPGGLADQTAAARGISREDAIAIAVAQIPRGRLATEDEIASVVAFLCGDVAANVAGAAWSVDGGQVPIII